MVAFPEYASRKSTEEEGTGARIRSGSVLSLGKKEQKLHSSSLVVRGVHSGNWRGTFLGDIIFVSVFIGLQKREVILR